MAHKRRTRLATPRSPISDVAAFWNEVELLCAAKFHDLFDKPWQPRWKDEAMQQWVREAGEAAEAKGAIRELRRSTRLTRKVLQRRRVEPYGPPPDLAAPRLRAMSLAVTMASQVSPDDLDMQNNLIRDFLGPESLKILAMQRATTGSRAIREMVITNFQILHVAWADEAERDAVLALPTAERTPHTSRPLSDHELAVLAILFGARVKLSADQLAGQPPTPSEVIDQERRHIAKARQHLGGLVRREWVEGPAAEAMRKRWPSWPM